MKSATALPATTPKLTLVPDEYGFALVTPTGRVVARATNEHDAKRIQTLWNEWRQA